MEHDSCRIAETVLIVSVGQRICIPCQYIVNLDWPDGEAVGDLDIESPAEHHGEGMLSASRICGYCRTCEVVANGFDLISISVGV